MARRSSWRRGPRAHTSGIRLAASEISGSGRAWRSRSTRRTQPPIALQIRGRATVEEVDGIAPEYRLAAERYLGAAANDYLAQYDGAAVGMARIAVRPAWVGLLDFPERLPGPLGGVR